MKELRHVSEAFFCEKHTPVADPGIRPLSERKNVYRNVIETSEKLELGFRLRVQCDAFACCTNDV